MELAAEMHVSHVPSNTPTSTTAIIPTSASPHHDGYNPHMPSNVSTALQLSTPQTPTHPVV